MSRMAEVEALRSADLRVGRGRDLSSTQSFRANTPLFSSTLAAISTIAPPLAGHRITALKKWNEGLGVGNDGYLVRVTSLAGVTGLFIWEICRLDGTQIQRSTKSFPTRVEALLDSAREAAALAFETLPQIPFLFG